MLFKKIFHNLHMTDKMQNLQAQVHFLFTSRGRRTAHDPRAIFSSILETSHRKHGTTKFLLNNQLFDLSGLHIARHSPHYSVTVDM